MDFRDIYANKLLELMEKDPRIVVIDADLAKANGTLALRGKFPDRAFDVGVAEANMACIAAGMASYGMVPFIGSFSAFATRRICDQIAISITYAKSNVKIIGSDPGISAELNGGTHMSMEDIGVLRSIPGIVIMEPCDGIELAGMVEAMAAYEGPVYMRLFRKSLPDIHTADYPFQWGKADVLEEGRDISIFASGIMVHEAKQAVKILASEGIDAELVNIHTIKPIDRAGIIASAKKTGAVVTVENHNVIGGLASAVAEVLIRDCRVPLEKIGIQDHFGEVGFMPYLKEKYSMTPDDIVNAAKKAIKEKTQ